MVNLLLWGEFMLEEDGVNTDMLHDDGADKSGEEVSDGVVSGEMQLKGGDSAGADDELGKAVLKLGAEQQRCFRFWWRGNRW